jgi:hypothetical protein
MECLCTCEVLQHKEAGAIAIGPHVRKREMTYQYDGDDGRDNSADVAGDHFLGDCDLGALRLRDQRINNVFE